MSPSSSMALSASRAVVMPVKTIPSGLSRLLAAAFNPLTNSLRTSCSSLMTRIRLTGLRMTLTETAGGTIAGCAPAADVSQQDGRPLCGVRGGPGEDGFCRVRGAKGAGVSWCHATLDEQARAGQMQAGESESGHRLDCCREAALVARGRIL